MATEPSSPAASSTTDPVEEAPGAAAHLIISARPFQGVKGEVHAKVPAEATGHVLNMLWRIVAAVVLGFAMPAVVLLLGPSTNLPPGWIAGLVAGGPALTVILVLFSYLPSARRRTGRYRRRRT